MPAQRAYELLCRRLNLFSEAIVAIDGSKFKAVNNRDKNFTVTKVAKRIEQVEASMARYLAALELPPALAAQKSHAGVCWPEFAALDWRGAGLAIEARPTQGKDRLGITGSFCAVAETGRIDRLSGGRLVLPVGLGALDQPLKLL